MSSLFGAVQSKPVFNKLWRMAGKPTLKIISPLSSWVLPAGVTYDRHTDQFVDGDGATVNVSWTEQPATEVRYLPLAGNDRLDLKVFGVTVVRTTSVIITWSPEVAELVQHAWGVGIDDVLYRLTSYQLLPAGSKATSIELSLVIAE